MGVSETLVFHKHIFFFFQFLDNILFRHLQMISVWTNHKLFHVKSLKTKADDIIVTE